MDTKIVRTVGTATATAATAFTQLIPPENNLTPIITALSYITGTTQHTLTVLKPFGTALVATDASASATALVLATDPGTGSLAGAMAQNDFVAYQHTDGTWAVQKLGSTPWAAETKTLTVSSLAKAVAAGQRLFFFGAPGDAGHLQLLAGPAAGSGTARVNYVGVELTPGAKPGDALLIHSDNATAAGFLDYATVAYKKAA
jgi:hypothetical protein